MGFFNKREDEYWNIWEDEDDIIEEDSQPITPQQAPATSKKFHFGRNSKKKQSNTSILGPDEDVNYLDDKSSQIYSKNNEDEFKISYGKIGLFLVGILLVFMGVIGYVFTDFDENNKGYVVTYDLHYERDYVKVSDNVLEYCEEIYEVLPELMQNAQTNTITVSNKLNEINNVLEAKTNELSRYTQIPEMMATYHGDLINFSLSTQKMIDTTLENCTAYDYMDWAAAAFTDFENGLDSLKVLRGEINTIIYRNVYGGGTEYE